MPNSPFKTWFFYLALTGAFVVLTIILFQGAVKFNIGSAAEASVPLVEISSWESFKTSAIHNLAEPTALLLMQIIAILLVSRLLGIIFVKIGQPTVIAEILAGIVLGPSLLGYFYPETYQFLFPTESMGNLYILSQVGLVLFMFVIGMELNLGMLKNKMGATFVISHASIIIPYFLGMLFAYFVYEEFAAAQTRFLPFALFIGISMSITAFPVLARIVQEKRLTNTHLGQMSITCAAFDDVSAWCILAAVIAIAKTGSIISSLFTIGLAIVYILIMLFIIKPFLKKIGSIYSNSEVLNKKVVAFIFLFLTASAFATQLIGVHALFGAFLAGVIMPDLPVFRKIIIEKIEDIALILLLPLFFVYTGLRTEIGLLNTPYLWWITLSVIIVAVAGKFIGGAVSAKIMGESWRDSLSMGVLMNTRGLMEIVVLNIGFEMGILPKPIFAMLVIMALVTTFMTTPLLSLIHKLFPEKHLIENYNNQRALGVFRVLIALGNPENGKALLQVAKKTLDGVKNSISVTALHITPGSDINPIYVEKFAEESFRGINAQANELGISIENDYRVADNIEGGVVRAANQENYDFLLVGGGFSLSGIVFRKESRYFSRIPWLYKLIRQVNRSQEIFFPGSLIKDKTKYFVENSRCSTGIFINRNFNGISTVLVHIEEPSDEFLIRYAQRLLKNDASIQIYLLDDNKLLTDNETVRQSYKHLQSTYPNAIRIVKSPRNNAPNYSRYSFMLISYKTWNTLTQQDDTKLNNIPSTLIINKKASRFNYESTNEHSL